MDGTTAAFILVAFLASAFLKGITGLGFSTICLGFLASFVDIKTAIPLLIIPSLSSNVLVMVDAGRFAAALRRFWPVYAWAVPGLALGLWVLGSIESNQARNVLGVVLFLYGLWGLKNARLALTAPWERWLSGPVGFTTGVVNGMTGSQVMPVLPYLLALGLDKNTLVQAINISFTLSSIIMLAGLGKLGLMNWQLAGMSAVGIAPVALGIWLGGRVRRRLPEDIFRRVVLIFLVVLGLTLVLRG